MKTKKTPWGWDLWIPNLWITQSTDMPVFYLKFFGIKLSIYPYTPDEIISHFNEKGLEITLQVFNWRKVFHIERLC